MSVNPDPIHPTSRQPPKTYADFAEATLEADTDNYIDEDAIKESPPRRTHTRQISETRPFGEVIDEQERSSRPTSPSLRHPKGRLEEQCWTRKMSASGESYAQAVSEHDPSKNNAVVEGNGVPPDARKAMANGNGTPTKQSAQHQVNGHKTPEAYEGAGEDEAPRAASRRAHKRGSPRQSKKDQEQQQHAEQDQSCAGTTPPVAGIDGNPDAQNQASGQLVYENLTNRSGENLATIKPFEDYRLSLQQRENKPQVDSPHQQSFKSRGRTDSELVSGRRAGAGWSQSAIRWAPLNVPLQRRLQTAMVLAHTLSIVGSLALFFLLCGIPILWPILVPYLLYCLLSRASVDGQLSFRSEWLRSMRVWSLFASYFPARLHRSATLEPNRKYIFGYHPHGIISHGAFAAFGTEALGFAQLFPGITNTLLTLDANFRIPLYRDYALRMGLASVSRESCENILSRGGPNGEGMGRAITIVIGGARESLDAKPYELKLVLKRRKGFVKLAIRTGADLVPVLAFGENDLYEQFDASAHPWIHKFQLVVKKFMGFTVPLFHARGVFNYDVGMMPYRRPINIVVGKPIPIRQVKTPDPAYVDEIHAQYVAELLRIWEDWRDVFARGRAGELQIVE